MGTATTPKLKVDKSVAQIKKISRHIGVTIRNARSINNFEVISQMINALPDETAK